MNEKLEFQAPKSLRFKLGEVFLESHHDKARLSRVKPAYARPITDAAQQARQRQINRLGGAKPPTARGALALAKSQAYQDAADAPATLRAYRADLAKFVSASCAKHGLIATPATSDVVGAYLAAAGEGYALPTLRRRVAAIARACGVAGHPLDTRHPAIAKLSAGSRAAMAPRRVAPPR